MPADQTILQEEPLYFSSGNNTLFGWLHSPAAHGSADWGLVICKPFGYETLCSHRSLRAFAQASALCGVSTLLFDYAGTGDSGDLDPQADQASTWIRDIKSAVEALRLRTGVRRVCLLGIRLGALLAAVAAQDCPSVDALALVAPVVSGRRYIRELRTTSLATSTRGDVDGAARTGTASAAAAATSDLESNGYAMSAATVATLSQLDLSKGSLPGVADALILDRSDLPGARAWADSMSQSGIRVEYQALPGFAEMALVAPYFSVTPQPMIDALRQWLGRLPGNSAVPAPASTPISITMHVPDTCEITLPAVATGGATRERPVSFGNRVKLFGIVTLPRPDEPRRRAVILLNTGVDNHTGASRMYVSLARAWARQGYTVLRLDLSGIGDSHTLPGRPDNEVYLPTAVDDIRDAVNFMRANFTIRNLTLAGVCSGAYHSLRAAVAGIAVDRLLMVNPLTFHWKDGMSLEGVQVAEVIRNPGVYRKRLVSASAWRRLLTGEVQISRILQVYIRRPMLALESVTRDLLRFLRIRLSHDLGRDLEQVAASGVQMVFVFARGEPGLELLRIQGGASLRKLGNRCHIHIVEDGDHTFTRSDSRAVVEQVLSRALTARPETAAA